MEWINHFNERNFILVFAIVKAGISKDLSFSKTDFQKGGMIPWPSILKGKIVLWRWKDINLKINLILDCPNKGDKASKRSRFCKGNIHWVTILKELM